MQNKKQARVTALVQEIKAAFAAVPYPGDNKITGMGDFEDEGVSVYFRGMRQEGHNVSNLRYHEVGLWFFLPKALHYFLPAYAIAVLKNPVESDTLYDTLISRFSKSDITKVIRHFSVDQRQAMIHYFEYCGENEENSEDENESIVLAIAKLKAA